MSLIYKMCTLASVFAVLQLYIFHQPYISNCWNWFYFLFTFFLISFLKSLGCDIGNNGSFKLNPVQEKYLSTTTIDSIDVRLILKRV